MMPILGTGYEWVDELVERFGFSIWFDRDGFRVADGYWEKWCKLLSDGSMLTWHRWCPTSKWSA